jgi:hypothetical protein
MSEKPDVVYREGKGMAFLRGNVEYQQEKDDDGKKKVFRELTRDSKIRIQEDTAVFVPVISTMFQIGAEYQGDVMNNELALRAVARRDTVNGGEISAQIRRDSSDTMTRLVPDLNDFYTETSLFPLSVPARSAYRSTIETPLEPGQYQALVVGVFVIIENLRPGLYRLAFFGRGVGKYVTRSEYDIRVYAGKTKLEDISGERMGNDNPMSFVRKWKDT